MSVEDDIQNDLTQLNDNIMKAAIIAAIGKTEDERVQASQLYDELTAQREKLQAAIKVSSYSNADESKVAPDPYARINYLEEQVAEAANNGEMANYSTMRNEKKQLIRDHGRKAAVVTSNTAAEMKARRDEQRESDLASRQRVEDEKANPSDKTFADESDLARKMTAAAESGDHKEYSRLRKLRKAG
jgi:hypothetical protein